MKWYLWINPRKFIIQPCCKEYYAIYMRDLRSGNHENFLKWNRWEEVEENEIFTYNDLYYIKQLSRGKVIKDLQLLNKSI